MLRPRALAAAALLLAAFVFRLGFGLSSAFWFEDETQIFLLGFRYHATHHWPFFGPDVVWTKSEIPGALQALLVGGPLNLVPAPEAPFVLLNVLSFAALAGFCVYICRRLPSLPPWLVWGWMLTIPWTLQFSTHIINPSYVLPAAIVFFVGFFEAMPSLSIGRIGRPLAHFMMGAALTWVMQIHMSWPLLLPFAGVAWVAKRDEGVAARALNAAAFLAGAAIPASVLLPTLLHYGIQAGSGGIVRNFQPHVVNPWIAVTTLARFLSFASLEIARFIATDGSKRVEFFDHHRWLIPLAAVVWLAGVVQPLWMLVELRRSRLRWVVVAAIALVYASYWTVMEPAQAHAFYVLAPIAWILAAECWARIDSPRWRMAAAALLVVNITFHGGLALAQAPERSLYKHRDIVMAAIAAGDTEMIAHRRAFAIDGGPASLGGPPYDVRRDVEVSATFARGPFDSLRWTVTMTDRNAAVAFRDFLFFTTYLDRDGRVLDERHEYIKDILEPGDRLTAPLIDGTLRADVADARIVLVAAEAVRPVPR